MGAMRTPKVLLSVLALAAAVAIATATLKADRDTPPVVKDVKEGKARRIKADKRTTAVCDGCRFHYLKTEENAYQFDDGSVANVSENPDPLPPKDKDCVGTRNPTAQEMAEKDRRTAELNGRNPGPGAPPPPSFPFDRYAGG